MNRRRMDCVYCGVQFRTRSKRKADIGLCPKCSEDVLLKALKPGKKSFRFDLHTMHEKWWHELIFRHAETGSLARPLGFKKLSFYFEKQRSDSRMGKMVVDYKDSGKNKRAEFDLAMKADDGTPVIVEVKRRATDSSIAQCMRYNAISKRIFKKKPRIILVTVELSQIIAETIESLRETGMDIHLYSISVGQDGMTLNQH